LNLTERQEKFYALVQHAHAGQKRKYTGEDYAEHPYSVACRIFNAIPDPGLLIEVALGHDLFEDTKVSPRDLKEFIVSNGYADEEITYVILGISSLTDIYTTEAWPHWNRSRRKEFEAHRLSIIIPAFQSVKYADLIDNMGSIVEHDKGFARLYVKEKEAILSRMRFGDIYLLIEAYQILWDAQKQLG